MLPASFTTTTRIEISPEDVIIIDWFMTVFVMVVAFALGIAIQLRRKYWPLGDPQVDLADVEPLELSLLAKRGDRMSFAVTGLATLMAHTAQPQITDPEDVCTPIAIPATLPAGTPPLLAGLQQRLAALGAIPPLDALKAAMETSFEEGERHLMRRGLVVDRWWSTLAPWMILRPIGAVFVLVWAILYTSWFDKEYEGFAILGGLVVGLVGLLAISQRPRLTLHGETIVEKAKAQLPELTRRLAMETSPRSPEILGPAVALLGTAALNETEHALLLAAVKTYLSDLESGCGSGGGCG